MKPLIDADVLRYEVGFSGEGKDEEGEDFIANFDWVAELLDSKIDLICDEVEATEPPTLYLTADKKLCDKMGLKYKPNFREAIAVTKPYKGTRVKSKPFHFDNLTHYMLGKYDVQLAVGIEADDLICIDSSKAFHEDTVICSRDKDLRMCPAIHYSWECGRQSSEGPVRVDGTGWLERRGDKVIGYGPIFFYYQLLVGDSVDNIPGLPRVGPVKALEALSSVGNERDCYEVVKSLYEERVDGDWLEYLKEQANLLWMVRELDEEGNPVLFSPPKKV